MTVIPCTDITVYIVTATGNETDSQARDCVCAIYAEAQQLHSEIVQMKQQLKAELARSAPGSKLELEREVVE